jgi:uncharacterized membrane protein YphA (DoxX/SURF4 family)
VGLTELVGGLMLIFGFFTRSAALAVVIFMINAVWFPRRRGSFGPRVARSSRSCCSPLPWYS